MDGGADLEVLGWDALDALEGGTCQRWVRGREPADGGDCTALLRDAVSTQAREVPDERDGVIDRDTCSLLVGGRGADGAGDCELSGDIAEALGQLVADEEVPAERRGEVQIGAQVHLGEQRVQLSPADEVVVEARVRRRGDS